MTSKCLEELDLTNNSIGELGGRELKEGLQYRKEGTCEENGTIKCHLFSYDFYLWRIDPQSTHTKVSILSCPLQFLVFSAHIIHVSIFLLHVPFKVSLYFSCPVIIV